MKTKIEIEVDVPEGWEFDEVDPLRACQHAISDSEFGSVSLSIQPWLILRQGRAEAGVAVAKHLPRLDGVHVSRLVQRERNRQANRRGAI